MMEDEAEGGDEGVLRPRRRLEDEDDVPDQQDAHVRQQEQTK